MRYLLDTNILSDLVRQPAGSWSHPPPAKEENPFGRTPRMVGTQKAPTLDWIGIDRVRSHGRQPRLGPAAQAHPGWQPRQPVLSFQLRSIDDAGVNRDWREVT